MGTANITIEVDEAAARAYAEASPGEQQKLQILLSLQLQELTVLRASRYRQSWMGSAVRRRLGD